MSPALRWFYRFGLLIIAALPLLVYELVALITRRTPTITQDTRDFIHSTWYVHLAFLLGWALLTSHLLAGWP